MSQPLYQELVHVVPFNGSEIMRQATAIARKTNEIHGTTQERVFIQDVLVSGGKWLGSVADQAHMLSFNADFPLKGAWPMDMVYRTDLSQTWICISNNGASLSDWSAISGGSSLHSGTGAPSSGLGANGDFYIDTAGLLLYGPKASGAWPSGVSLVGPAGKSVWYGVVRPNALPSNSIGNDGDTFIANPPTIYQIGNTIIPASTPTFVKTDLLHYLTIPDTTPYHLGDFTFEIWYKAANAAGASSFTTRQTLFSNIVGSGDGIAVQVLANVSGGSAQVPAMLILLNSGGVQSTINGVADMSTYGQYWQGIAITRSGSTLKVYIDTGSGYVLDQTSTLANGTAWSAPGPITLGAQNFGGYAEALTGDLSEFRIWNVARTLTQLNSLRSQRIVPTSLTNLVSNFRLDEIVTTAAVADRVSFNNGTRGSAAAIDLFAGAQLYGPKGQTTSGVWDSFNILLAASAGATGATGAAGAAATIAVGTVTALSAGATPTITNSGSSSAATFNFGIPAGATGATGPAGSPGNGDSFYLYTNFH